jgi:hypothetical protein
LAEKALLNNLRKRVKSLSWLCSVGRSVKQSQRNHVISVAALSPREVTHLPAQLLSSIACLFQPRVRG